MSSVERALSILFAVAEQGSARVTDLAEDLGLDKATVSRLGKSLIRWGLLEQDPDSRALRLGPGTAWLGARYLGRQEIRTVARELLVGLSQRTGRSVALVMLSGDEAILIDRVDGTHWLGVQAEIGQRMPLTYRASCKAMLAHLPRDQIQRILDNAAETSPSGRPIRRDEREAELETIRRRGYAVSREEVDKGVTGIGAPIFDAEGKVIAAISVATATLTVQREEEELRLAKAVCETAKAISKKLGFEFHLSAGD
ncbi:MAG: IclR family transcriptional regulator [Firmicutes bacterium]|nr:IclR family transcriptional regulator [Bacillota bacterium]